jgi:hypothetical protein
VLLLLQFDIAALMGYTERCSSASSAMRWAWQPQRWPSSSGSFCRCTIGLRWFRRRDFLVGWLPAALRKLIRLMAHPAFTQGQWRTEPFRFNLNDLVQTRSGATKAYRDGHPPFVSARHRSPVSEFAQFALITFTSVLFIVDPVAAGAVLSRRSLGRDGDQRSGRRSAPVSRWRSCSWCSLRRAAGYSRPLESRCPHSESPAASFSGLWRSTCCGGQRSTQEGREELAEGEAKEDVAGPPLAIPILAGPGRHLIPVDGTRGPGSRPRAWRRGIPGDRSHTHCFSYVTLRLGERLVIYLGQTGIQGDGLEYGAAAGRGGDAVHLAGVHGGDGK